jgi:hypothetical protein
LDIDGFRFIEGIDIKLGAFTEGKTGAAFQLAIRVGNTNRERTFLHSEINGPKLQYGMRLVKYQIGLSLRR